jgi:hypothetical protein
VKCPTSPPPACPHHLPRIKCFCSKFPSHYEHVLILFVPSCSPVLGACRAFVELPRLDAPCPEPAISAPAAICRLPRPPPFSSRFFHILNVKRPRHTARRSSWWWWGAGRTTVRCGPCLQCGGAGRATPSQPAPTAHVLRGTVLPCLGGSFAEFHGKQGRSRWW